MKNNLILGVLLGLLGLGAVISMVLSFRVVMANRAWNRQQLNMLVVNNNNIVAQNLVNELVEYSKTHPTVEPLLAQLRSRTNIAVPPTNR